MIDVMKMLKARMWMKRNVPFLYSWHAYVGYELSLFDAFDRPMSKEDVADAYNLDMELLNEWVTVGVAIGHLKPVSRNRYKTWSKWKLPKSKEEGSSGVLLKEMMELHIPSLLSYPERMRAHNRNHFESEKHAPTVAQTSRLLEVIALPKITRHIKNRENVSLLDVGCGEAGYIRRLAERFPDARFQGIEISDDVVVKAKELTAHLDNVEVDQGDVWEYESNDRHNIILMNNLLHYIPLDKRPDLFKRLKGWLNDDGVISVITPLTEGEKSTPFVAAFNSFFTSFENLHSLPKIEDMKQYGEEAGLEMVDKNVIIREGSWYVVTYKKKKSSH